MKLIKNILVVAMLAFALTVSAQDLNKKAMNTINSQVKEMVDVMGLNKKQEAKITGIKKAQWLTRKEVAKNHEKGTAEFDAKMKEANQNAWKEIKEECSKEQLKKWYAYQKAKKNK